MSRPRWPNPVGLNFVGPYSDLVKYDPYDAVMYAGGAYYTPRGLPFAGFTTPDDIESGYWIQLAEHGPDNPGAGHIIRNPAGASMTARPALRFMSGFQVNDSSGSNETRVIMPAPKVPTQTQLEGIMGTAIAFADIDLTVAGNFTATDLDFPPQFALDRGGVVHLRGQVHATGSGQQLIFKLEPLFRPTMTERFPVCKVDGSATFVVVEAGGNVYVTAGSGENVHLDGVNFASDIAFGGIPKGVPPHFQNDWTTGSPEMLIHGKVIAGQMVGFGDGDVAFTFDKPFVSPFPETYTFVGIAEIVGGGDPVFVNLEVYEFDSDQLALRVNVAAGDTLGSPVALAGKVV